MHSTIDENTFSISNIMAVLARRRWLILGIFTLVFSCAVAYTILAPKQYSTRMKVLVKNERADMIVTAKASDGARSPEEVSESQINSEIELLTSNDLLRSVVLKSGLEQRETGLQKSAAIERAVDRLQHNLKVTPVRKADVIVAEYTDRDARVAAAVLSNLSELYLENHLKIHGTPGTYEFFKNQADAYKTELTRNEALLTELRRRENVDILPEQKEVALKKSSEDDSVLMQAEASVRDYERRIEDTRRQLDAAQPRVVTQTRAVSNQYTVERLNTMLAELQNRRTELLTKYRSEDRLVQQVDQEIADTRAALDQAARLRGVDESTDVNPVHQALAMDLAKETSELAGLRARRDELKRQASIDRSQTARLAGITASFDDLVRAQKEAEDNYLLYSRKAEEARITDSLDRQKIANVAIAEAPVQPQTPSKPKVPLNLAIGFAAACCLSLGAAFGMELLRTSVEDAQELEDLTGLPVLATSYGD